MLMVMTDRNLATTAKCNILWKIQFKIHANEFTAINSKKDTFKYCFQVFFSVLQGAQNVGLTAPHLEAISTARASASSVYAVIDREPAIDIFSTEGEKPALKGDIVFKDVYFKYPARNDVQV